MSYVISRVAPVLSLCLLAASAGCASPDDPFAATNAELVQQGSTISFLGNYTQQVSGTLIAGQPVGISYDENRLTQCRGYQNGQPAWSIAAYYQLDGGAVQQLPVAGSTASATPTISLPSSGALQMWFVNSDVWGCVAYDSAYGQNYHFQVQNAGVAWAGLETSVISRCTVQGQPCASDYVPLSQGFMFDTWARQRALISNVYFEAWEPGVTDWDNPNLWQQLDVQIHYRFDPAQPFDSDYVNFDQRLGNNARYAVNVRSLDPFGGNTIVNPQDCPAFPYWVAANPAYVEAQIEFYFTINGQELRPAPNAGYVGTFQDYVGLYAVCNP